MRLSDFKTNEYANLIGGVQFEPKEENPMLGFRGASRYYSPLYREGFALECKAIKRAREEMGFNNTATTITVTARLTSIGRERLLKESSSILSHFIIGDSDANYHTSGVLSTGEIPSTSGNRDETGLTNINISTGIQIKSKLYKSNTNAYLKGVEKNCF